MRRIAVNVAVETLLYTMTPTTLVRIIDVDHHMWASSEPWEECSRSNGTNFTVGEILYDASNVKIAKAKIYRTVVSKVDGVLVLVIDTLHEEY